MKVICARVISLVKFTRDSTDKTPQGGRVSQMDVVVRAHKEATVVDLHGRLDSAARWNFKAIMNQCCLNEQDHLVINLQSLSYIDSAGLGFLVLAYIRFTGLQRRMSWVQPRGHVKTLLDKLNIPAMVPIFATEEEAFESTTA